jgi:catechol 2,3-dioxygenase-like lactoylglutathione lyase family enzyme
MKPEAVLETVLYASDLDEAERFYTDILGLVTFSRGGDRHVFFRCGEQMILIFNPEQTVKPTASERPSPPPHGSLGEGHLCFRANREQIDQWYDHLVACGIEIESDFQWPGGGRSIYFRDPAGNSLEFAEPQIWGIN